MNFRKYMHIERLGNDGVQGIELGKVYVFPKIDGTNASMWTDDELNVHAGSRQRVLTVGADNAGFREWAVGGSAEARSARALLLNHSGLRLYGEWLVPHTLKTYREDAWRRFYVFDVGVDDGDEGYRLLPFEEYKPLLFGIDYISPLGIVTNGTPEDFTNALERNHYLLPDGSEPGEGVVLKRYDFVNRYGHTVWAKLVRNEFKEKHHVEMGSPELTRADYVEQSIVDDTVTLVLVDKVAAKITVDKETGWRTEYVPRLLGEVYHDIVTEELWSQLKKRKSPTVDFKRLRSLCIERVKLLAPERF